MECNKDCNKEYNDYTSNCDNSINSDYYSDLEIYGKLSIQSIRDQIFLCFYGLNIDDPYVYCLRLYKIYKIYKLLKSKRTNYDLICFERTSLNTSGVVSYEQFNTTLNDRFWGNFAIGQDMDYVWVLLCGALVFFMQLGFSLYVTHLIHIEHIYIISDKHHPCADYFILKTN